MCSYLSYSLRATTLAGSSGLILRDFFKPEIKFPQTMIQDSDPGVGKDAVVSYLLIIFNFLEVSNVEISTH